MSPASLKIGVGMDSLRTQNTDEYLEGDRPCSHFVSLPIHKGILRKFDLVIFLAVLALVKIAVCIETDVYVPSFPQMVSDLKTSESNIQWVLGINFLGLCFSSLWVGLLADRFGRRKTLLVGLFLFVVSSLGCVWSNTLSELLFWRFLQGLGAGTPMTAGFAILMDRFDAKTAASLIGFMNTVITLSMAGAPILGTWITLHFHWKANFILIAVLGILAWISFYLCIPETLSKDKRITLHIKPILRDYMRALSHRQFLAYTMICVLIFGGIIVFVTNQSLIFINYLNIGQDIYGYYQSSTMASFAIGSLLSGLMIRRIGTEGTRRACILLAMLGGAGLFATALSFPKSAELICFGMVLIALGGGLGIGSIAAAAMEVFPHMKGTASGIMGFLRLILTSGMVSLSAHFFDGSIFPVAAIIGGAQALACVIYFAGARGKSPASVPNDKNFGAVPAIH
jgi:MFS transporter, DHA1 family, multidrug resistance protein